MRDAELSSPLVIEQSDGPAHGEVQLDHERLRYVTSLLGSQEGLNTALLGALLFLMNADEALEWLNGWWRLLVWAARLAGAVVVLADWIPKYYQRRFGSVQAAPKRWSKWEARFFLAFLVLLIIGWPIAHYLDLASHLHTMISDPGRQINLWPSVFWVALLCGSLPSHMSIIERQRLYFGFLVAFGLAFIASYAIWHPDAKQLFWWKILNAGEFGLSFIAMGLYDYVSLVLLLPKRAAESDDES